MKIFVSVGLFVLLISQLAAAESVEELEEPDVESPLHNLVKRSNPAHYGYKATGKVKVGAPVVVKAPVFKEVATFVQDGFKYSFPNRGGNVRGGNFNRAGGYPYGYYPYGYQFQGGYPYRYGSGYPNYYQRGYPYGYRTGYPFVGTGVRHYSSGFKGSAKGFGSKKIGY